MRIIHGLIILTASIPLMNCFGLAAQDPNSRPLRLSLAEPSSKDKAQPVSAIPLNWTAYMGLEAQFRDWTQTIRIPGRPDIAESPVAIDKMIATMKPVLAQKRALIVPIGGLVSARFPDRVRLYLDKIQQDQGKAWKERVYRQAMAVAKHAPNSKYAFQVGNEINSRHYTETMSLWRGNPSQAKYIQNDETIIPIYVEYYLAPTVEAIRKASREAYKGDDNRMKIMLGSLANANNDRSQEWLQALLTYRVEGKYAPSLAGQQVNQLVNIISTHYLVTADDQDWRNKLNTLWGQWVGRGRVTGIWATEELGKQRALKGRGAETALKVTARYLDWWSSRKIRPEQSRISFWGWEMGQPKTRGEDGMAALYQCLGNVPLRSLPLKDNQQLQSQDLEAHLFETTTAPRKRALFLFPTVNLEKMGRGPGKQRQNQLNDERPRKKQRPQLQNDLEDGPADSDGNSPTIALPSTIAVAGAGWTTPVKTKLQRFSAAGISSWPVPTARQNGEYQLTLPQNLSLSQQNVALFCLTQTP
jgi:hypothetical protein